MNERRNNALLSIFSQCAFCCSRREWATLVFPPLLLLPLFSFSAVLSSVLTSAAHA